jgi:hypothetical protein
MSTRDQLEKTLAQQRLARAQRAYPPAPRKSQDLLGALAVIAILAASGAALFFAVDLTTPKTDGTATLLPSPLPSPSASPLASATATFMVTPVAMKVCTDIPDGRLHVRFTAGEGSEVRGYLAEGEAVQITPDSQTIRSKLWRRISSPVAGWVNARYLCES